MITIPALVGIQADELRAVFPALELFGRPAGPWKIIGSLGFTATHNKVTLTKTIPIMISIPSDFPKTLPTVKEHLSALITNFPHVNIDDKTFCLGTQISLRIRFSENPTLLFFVKELLIPYLYSAFFWLKKGVMPFPDRDHGLIGLLQEYCLLLDVHDPLVVIKFLTILADSKLTAHRLCPCGSGKALRLCHIEKIRAISNYQSSVDFLVDLTLLRACYYGTNN